MQYRAHYTITNNRHGRYELLTDTTARPEVLVLDAIGLLKHLREDRIPEEQIKRIFLTLDREQFITVSLPKRL
jgi:hypothetical protein